MTRIQLANMLYRRTQTVKFAYDSVRFLNDLSKPAGFASGLFTEVDGDAIAILRAVTS